MDGPGVQDQRLSLMILPGLMRVSMADEIPIATANGRFELLDVVAVQHGDASAGSGQRGKAAMQRMSGGTYGQCQLGAAAIDISQDIVGGPRRQHGRDFV